MKVTFPMPIYKTTSDLITYRELRQVLNKGITYARSHFDLAMEDLESVQSSKLGGLKAGLADATRATTIGQIKATEELSRAIKCTAVASQRLYLTLTLKRALNRFYNVLERLEKKAGGRTEKIAKAIDFSMRGQHRPNFLATITVLEWGYRNQLGESSEYVDFPTAALLQLSESIPPCSQQPCIAPETMVQLESGDIIPVSQLPVGARLLGASVQLVKSEGQHNHKSGIAGNRTPIRGKGSKK